MPDRSTPARCPRSCVIVDDERRGREFLANILSSHFPEISLAGQAQSVEEAVALIASIKPDIVFLDIEIIGGTGFDVLDRIGDERQAIVFISAHAHYQEESARYPHAGFLLKPVSILDLRAVLKICDEMYRAIP